MIPEFDEFANDYDVQLQSGLSLTGETSSYFALRRLEFLYSKLKLGRPIKNIMDFGCGPGSTTPLLQKVFPGATITGIDESSKCIETARQRYQSGKAMFFTTLEFKPAQQFDLIYCNGVFHHIPPAERQRWLIWLRNSLSKGGGLALWENNPWNPATRWVMSRIAFDKNAKTISVVAAQSLLSSAGFRPIQVDFMFIFPKMFNLLRPLEALVTKIPVGAQYQILSTY